MIQASIVQIRAEDLRSALFDILILLNNGSIEEAKNRALHHLGEFKSISELSSWSQIEVRLDTGSRVYVKVMNEIQARAWSLRAVDYKAAFNQAPGSVVCTVTAIADVRDVSK